MLSTYASYQLITRDLSRTMERLQAQPMVERETSYYLDNITKVKSIEEFVSNDRLFRYAMKAHGLQDMAYAKAFMVKALTEGISDPNSFANKLTDKRYAEFVKSYNFAALKEDATVYNPAQQGTTNRYMLEAVNAGVDPLNSALQTETDYYLENIVDVKSIDDLLTDDRLFTYAVKAFGLLDKISDKPFIRQVLEGGIDDPESFANKLTDKRFVALAESFDFMGHGETATTYNPAQAPAVQRYMRQTLEEDAGSQNEGVRLALYFARKASSIETAYSILSDPALAQVVRTVLGLPDSLAAADIDRQAAMIEDRLDLADFQDPEALGKFITRFTAMWEISHPSEARLSPVAVLFSQPVEAGISTDILLTLQRMKY